MEEALHHALRLVSGGPLAEIARGPVVPERSVAAGDGLRANVTSFHHPVGTCRMGPDPAAGDVVDSRGCVHGVEGLWVADASIMPTIPSAPTHVPTIMVAERIAGWIGEAG